MIKQEHTYAPKNKYAWDTWFIKSHKTLYAFYLQSPKTPKDPEKRHHTASIGVATADPSDLWHWKERGTAIPVGKKGEWDSLAIWTGSVLEIPGKGFKMLYTARNNTKLSYWIQKIGLASSLDGIHWQKYTRNPILESDSTYYSMDNIKTMAGTIKAWRDPYLFRDEKTKKIYTTISANTKDGGIYSGTIAIAEALSYVRKGDTLVVWRLDRLGRSLKHLIETIGQMEERGVGFRSLQESIDTTTSGGRLIFQIFGALAEFERNLIQERTQAGLTAARARGRKGGRPKALDSKKTELAYQLYDAKKHTIKEICQMLGISKPYLYAYLQQNNK